MDDGQLLSSGGFYHLRDAADVAAFIGREAQAELRGVSDDVEHTAIGDVHGHRAQLRHLDLFIQVGSESGHVAEGNLLHLAVCTIGTHVDEAGWRFQSQLCDRFLHGQHASFQ